jgi:hypothetical protein
MLLYSNHERQKSSALYSENHAFAAFHVLGPSRCRYGGAYQMAERTKNYQHPPV